MQKLETNLHSGRYPPSREGFSDFCKHAKLIGLNAVQYNKDDRYWEPRSQKFLQGIEELIGYTKILLQGQLR
jgi:hypothetical protein